MLDTVRMRGPFGGSRRTKNPRRKGRFLATLAALFAAPVMAFPAPHPEFTAPANQPAMWAISDEDTTIFLFGTFHALDASTDWFSPTIRAALGASEQLVLETIVPSSPFELQGTLMRHQMAKAPVAGQPIVSSDAHPGFVEGARRTMDSSRSAGMSFETGADAVLRRTAEAQGKPVEGLESFDSQLGMFATISKIAATAPPPAEAVDQKATILRLRNAWRVGNAGEFAVMLGAIRNQSPETYRILFADRNQRWAEWIARRLDQPGVAFVAVGAGHLTGGDSIQAALARRGIRTHKVS